MEVWKDVPGFEKYQVSNLGRIRSLKNNKITIIKTYVGTNGYIQACFWQNKKCNKVLLHRIVATCFVSNPNNYNEVNHKDENKANNCADNLEWCVHLYNMRYGHCFEKISQKAKFRKLSDEHKEKLRIDSSKKRWVNNGQIESFTYKDNIGSLLEKGWKLGRLERRW